MAEKRNYQEVSERQISVLEQRCQDVIVKGDWGSGHQQGFDNMRSVTWSQYPFTYMLNEFANNFDAKHCYELSTISAPLKDTGLHQHSRFFMVEGELAGVFHSEVKLATDFSEEDEEQYRSNFNFTLENGFDTPNAEDKLFVEHALDIAFMDGVRPFERTGQ